MKRIALTGGIATGKSHVRARFEALGVPTIDADVLARDAVAPGSAGLAEVVRVFGPEFVDASGALDRQQMAARVFSNPAARRALERIVHPVVHAEINRWFDALPASTPFAIADIPLLYETGRQGEFDAVIVTACEPETQVARVLTRDGLTEAEARARISAQLPISDKVAQADYIIATDGAPADTDLRVLEVYAQLAGSWS